MHGNAHELITKSQLFGSEPLPLLTHHQHHSCAVPRPVEQHIAAGRGADHSNVMLQFPSPHIRRVGAYERQPKYRAHACTHSLRVERVRAIAQKKKARSPCSVRRSYERPEISRRPNLPDCHPARAIADRHLFKIKKLLTQDCSDSRSPFCAGNGSKLLGRDPAVRGAGAL